MAIYAWGTAQEQDFVRRLGRHRTGRTFMTGGRDLDRIPALLNYRAAASRRSNWGQINKAEVLALVEELLYQAGHVEPDPTPPQEFREARGRGLVESRQYAVPVRMTRTEVREAEEDCA